MGIPSGEDVAVVPAYEARLTVSVAGHTTEIRQWYSPPSNMRHELWEGNELQFAVWIRGSEVTLYDARRKRAVQAPLRLFQSNSFELRPLGTAPDLVRPLGDGAFFFLLMQNLASLRARGEELPRGEASGTRIWEEKVEAASRAPNRAQPGGSEVSIFRVVVDERTLLPRHAEYAPRNVGRFPLDSLEVVSLSVGTQLDPRVFEANLAADVKIGHISATTDPAQAYREMLGYLWARPPGRWGWPKEDAGWESLRLSNLREAQRSAIFRLIPTPETDILSIEIDRFEPVDIVRITYGSGPSFLQCYYHLRWMQPYELVIPKYTADYLANFPPEHQESLKAQARAFPGPGRRIEKIAGMEVLVADSHPATGGKDIAWDIPGEAFAVKPPQKLTGAQLMFRFEVSAPPETDWAIIREFVERTIRVYQDAANGNAKE